MAVPAGQDISPPPLSVEEEAPVQPAGAVPQLPLRGRGHLSEQMNLARARARARATQIRGIPLFPLPPLSPSTGTQDLPAPSGFTPPRRQDVEARVQRNRSEQLLRTFRRTNRVPLVSVNAERVARALIPLNGDPFHGVHCVNHNDSFDQLAREVQIPPNQLAELLRHLQAVVSSYIAEQGSGLRERSTLLHSLLSMTSLTNVAFAAAGGQLRAAALYSRLDAEINRLRTVEYPRILHLLRQQIQAIGGYIDADAVEDRGSGRRLTQRRIPARTFGVEDVMIPEDLTRQQQYRELLDHFYQRSNDNDPITAFGEDYTMISFRWVR